ncbi:MAG: 23S rRNA (uracil(1939)-C(5))-methyltransferase RlmD [Magnetococcales bacterium]|nr:23S rRNA (uracil(1939)-C(5))-methyltransferase RlmD [Magnetococcales bacterium]
MSGDAMERLDLEVEKLVTGGRGLARSAGMAVFIPGAVPGDRLRVRITGRRHHHATAEIVEVVQPGPGRVSPLCLHFASSLEKCGGCQLQQLDIEYQRAFKKDIVAESLLRIGHFAPLPAITPMAEVSPPWNYRRKAGFKIRRVRDRLLFGFHQAGSHRVIDLDHCPVLRPEINHLIAPLRALVQSLSVRDRVPQIDVMSGDRGVGLVMHLIEPLSPRDRQHCLAFAREQGLARFDLQQGRKERLVSLYQEGSLEYVLEGMSLKFLPVDFIQVNGAGNVNLVARAMEMVGEGQRAWDLFSGIGNFTLPLARRYQTVLAVEGNRSSLDRLRLNGHRAGFAKIERLHGDLFSASRIDSLGAGPVPELILLDPPRDGAVELCRRIGQFIPKRLVYVSCDPATFSRDAAVLCHFGGHLRRVEPLDLFPHTAHVELVALFDWGG